MRPMGQLVGVVEKPSTTAGVVRFELNRSLTGLGHERYTSVLDAVGATPAAMLARQLFASGRVDAVHVFGNMVTVDVAKGYDTTGLAEIVREMYRYWKPGVEPPSFEDLQPEEPAAVMVFQDGSGPKDYVPVVFDNLIARKEIPVTIGVFINPGVVPAATDRMEAFYRATHGWLRPHDHIQEQGSWPTATAPTATGAAPARR